jgi:Flp pilus assembly protein TadD/peroxiredoxin
VETDRLRLTRIVQAGSGFLSQRSKQLVFGLGASQRVAKVTVVWPSGREQVLTDVTPNSRLHVVEGGAVEREPLAAAVSAPSPAAAPNDTAGIAGPPNATWLYEPFPAPDFAAEDLQGEARSLAALKGRPAVLLFWSIAADGSSKALASLARDAARFAQAGIGVLAIALDDPKNLARVRAASPTGIPVIVASREVALSYAILNRHVFMNRQDLRLPTAFLVDAAGSVVKAYRDRVDAADIVRDAAAIGAPAPERLARATPFPGTWYSPLPVRNYLPYGRELLDQGLEAAAVVAFERAAQANPSPSTLYRLGTLLAKSGDKPRARAAFERALALQPDLAEANNDLGALLAQDGQLDAAIAQFRTALASTPEYPDALNNLGYALLLTGHDQEARALYEKAIALQPDFPEALNNMGMLAGRSGDLDAAERSFRQALVRRPGYGEAVNNLALVLIARGRTAEAIPLLTNFLEKSPKFEGTYITLAKIYLNAGRRQEGLAVLERLLHMNPTHPQARELLQQFK